MTLDQINELRQITGCGVHDAKRGLEKYPDDVYMAAGWLYASALAINIRDDREAWNHEKAAYYAEILKERVDK